jgi:Leucine-rich repeat (LRR) protein
MQKKMYTTPEIVQLCGKLQSNDSTLTHVNLNALPCFQLSVAETVGILQALENNTVVTHLELDISQHETNNQLAIPVLTLLRQILKRNDCPIQSLTISSAKADTWCHVFRALQSNHSVKRFEMGIASAMFKIENCDVLNTSAYQQLSTALCESVVEDFSLRNFHITSEGWTWLIQGLRATRHVELHQITCETNLFHYLGELCEVLESLSFDQCRFTLGNNDGVADSSSSFVTRTTNPRSEDQAAEQYTSRIRMLRIAECQMSQCLSALVDLDCTSSMQKLDLRDTDLQEEIIPTFARWVGKLSHLENIGLEGCHLTENGVVQILEQLRDHTNVREINLRRNKLFGETRDSFPTLPRNLVSMDLSQNDNVGDSTWLRSIMVSNPQVQRWFLSYTKMGTLGLRGLCLALSDMRETSNITVLSLSGNKFKNEGIQCLSSILRSSLLHLKELDLSNCKLDNNDVTSLSISLKGHLSLSKLSIAHNVFDNASCPFLAKTITVMPRLHSLDMQFGRYDKQALTHFVPALKANPRLCRLTYWTRDFCFSKETNNTEKSLSLLLSLNQAGRQVSIQEDFPINLIPLVLERADRVGQKQCLFCIVRDNVDRVFGGIVTTVR